MPPLPTIGELVDAAAATYRRADPFVTTPDGAVRAFLDILPSSTALISIEGTHNRPGWIVDFDAFAADDPIVGVVRAFCATGTIGTTTLVHPQLGLLHAGFNDAALAIMPKLALAVIGRPFAIAGHSLGAAVALRIGAEFILDGTPPLIIGAFAPPRIGGDKLVKLLSAVQISAWKWGDDPVPEVPFTLPPHYDYRQVPLTKTGKFLVDAFACHNINNYVAAVHQEQN